MKEACAFMWSGKVVCYIESERAWKDEFSHIYEIKMYFKNTVNKTNAINCLYSQVN